MRVAQVEGVERRDDAESPTHPTGPDSGAAVRRPRRLDDRAAIDLLTEVVHCYSPSGEESRAAQLLASAMTAAGANSHVDAVGNAVGTWGGGPLNVTFLGHIDTVPGAIPVRVLGGVLHGRGSVDAKGSLCAAVAAASRLGEEALARITLRVVGAVGEEAPESRGARHAVTTLPRPDLVIIGEPSGWERYTLGYKGRLALLLEAERGSAHSAREEPSAPELLLDAYAALRRWVEQNNRGSSGAFDRLQVTLRNLTSSEDGISDRCSGEVSFRLPPRWSAEELRGRLDTTALPPGVTMRTLSSEEPYRGENGSPLARAFRVAIRAHGGRPRPALKTGTSDMNVVAPHWPVPMLAYGPGDANLDHTPEERLPLDEYLRAVEVLGAVLSDGQLATD